MAQATNLLDIQPSLPQDITGWHTIMQTKPKKDFRTLLLKESLPLARLFEYLPIKHFKNLID